MKSNSNSILSGSLFNPQKIPEDAKEILDNFDSLIQDAAFRTCSLTKGICEG